MIYINILYSRLIEGKDETGKRLALDKQVTCKTTRKSKKKRVGIGLTNNLQNKEKRKGKKRLIVCNGSENNLQNK